jgi:acetyltransferase-like isoleucine patch superfamily enzyme
MLQNLLSWFRFRLYCNLAFLRPANFILEGSIKADLFSFISFDKNSIIRLGNGFCLKKSIIRVTESEITIGKNAQITDARLLFSKSKIQTGDSFKVKGAMVSLNNGTLFTAGNYLMICKEDYHKAGFFANNTKVQLGENVNIRAHISCSDSVFTIGNNVFLNQGTQVRCHQSVQFGSNILVSYECIIFDTNTHAADPENRYQEMKDGFPNQAIQTEATKAKVITAPVVIGNNAWIGIRAIILKGTELGDAVIVGAAAVVSGKKVPNGKIVYGNPAIIKE